MGKAKEKQPDRVIVINDDDGHTNAYAFTDDNMRKLLLACIKAEDCNTFLDQEDLQKLVDASHIMDTLSADQLADLIAPLYSQRHAQVCVMTITPEFDSRGWW